MSRWHATVAVVLAGGGLCLASCSGESKAQVQYAAIVAGCQASIEVTAGAGGEESSVRSGCRTALHAWEFK